MLHLDFKTSASLKSFSSMLVNANFCGCVKPFRREEGHSVFIVLKFISELDRVVLRFFSNSAARVENLKAAPLLPDC